MPQLLTTSAKITCPHGGTGQTTPSSQDWKINDGYVCLEQDTGVLTCPYCVSYILKSMGLNATKIDQKKTVLVTDFNTSITGLPLLLIETHPVNDQSVPAPIPAGQEPPPLSPEMADTVAPIVVGVPPSFPFKITPPPAPVPVVVTFSLSTTYPLKWLATLIQIPGGAPGQHFDLTGGIPPNVSLVPSGGEWSTPMLTVTVTLQPPFVSSLGPGNHELYLIGVSRRGLSGYGKSIIAVSP